MSKSEVFLDLLKRQVFIHQLTLDTERRECLPVDAGKAASAGKADEHLLEDAVVCSQAGFTLLQVLGRFDEILQFDM